MMPLPYGRSPKNPANQPDNHGPNVASLPSAKADKWNPGAPGQHSLAPPAPGAGPLHVVSVANGMIHLSDGTTMPIGNLPKPAAVSAPRPNEPLPFGRSPKNLANKPLPSGDWHQLKLEQKNPSYIPSLPPGLDEQTRNVVNQLNKQAQSAKLTPELQQKYHEGAQKRDQTLVAAQNKKNQVVKLTKLAKQGPDGIRQVQATLNRAGFNIPTTGVMDQETQMAFSQYLQQQQGRLTDVYGAAYRQADPYSLEALGNHQLDQPVKAGGLPHIELIRNFLNDQWQQELQGMNEQLQALDDKKANQQGILSSNDQELYKNITSSKSALLSGMTNINDPSKLTNLQVKSVFDAQVKSNHAVAVAQAQVDDKIEKQTAGWDNIKSDVLGVTKGVVFGQEGETLNVAPLHNPAMNYFGDSFGRGFDAAMYAGQLEGSKGGNSWSRAAAGISAFSAAFVDFYSGGKGGTFLAKLGGDTAVSEALDATNTASKRRVLTQNGLIESVGQKITGHDTAQYEKLHGATPFAKLPSVHIGSVELVSGAVDLAFIYAKDPSIVLQKGLSVFEDVGALQADKAGAKAVSTMVGRYGEDVLQQQGALQALATMPLDEAKNLTSEELADLGKRTIVATAKRATREAFMDGTATGRTLSAAIHEIMHGDLTAINSVDKLQAIFKDLPSDIAEVALDAIHGAGDYAETRYAAEAAIKDAFKEGDWIPKVSALRQAGIYVSDVSGGRIFGEAGAEDLGKAVSDTGKVRFLRRLASEKGAMTSTFEHNAMSFANDALDTAAEGAGHTWQTAYHEMFGDVTDTLVNRFWRVAKYVDAADIADLTAMFEGMVRPFMVNTDILGRIPLITFEDGMFVNPALETVIQRMETGIGILQGDLGADSAAQFQRDLVNGFAVRPNWERTVTALAAGNTGVFLGKAGKGTLEAANNLIEQLPEDVQAAFKKRLEDIGPKAKSSIGRVIRDTKALLANEDLLAETQRLIEQNTRRLDQVAEEAVKGSARRAVPKLLSKMVLSNIEQAAPREMVYEGRSTNKWVLSAMRAKAARRLAQAYYIPEEISNQLINRIAGARTEQEFFDGVQRLLRVGMEAMGVENGDSVMEILKNQGKFDSRFTSSGMIRSVDEHGDPVTDLQALSQRLERITVPRPQEVSAAVRQSILDGTTDASTARRLRAMLGSAVDDAGQIKLWLTRPDGTQWTIKSSAHAMHNFWKFLVVSNAGLPVIGAVGGYVGTKGDFWHKMGGAAEGFALGSLGMTRFAFKTAGIDDRIRMAMTDGINPDTMIPGWARIRTRRYGEDALRRTMSDEVVKVGNYGVQHFENDFLVHTDPDWVVLETADKRAPDALYRVVNFQIHPESDPVMNILLRERANLLDTGLTGEAVQVADEEAAPILKKNAVPEAPKVEATVAEGMDELHAALKDVLAETEGGTAHLTESQATNEDLLELYADEDVKTYYRGEPAEFQGSARGAFWHESEDYAAKAAGEGGIVYSVDLPAGESGVPLVGESAVADGEVGWKLEGETAEWADAAVPTYSPSWEAATKSEVQFRGETQREVADRMVAEFLDTEEGQLWVERWKTAKFGTSKPDAAIARMRDFLEKFTNEDIAAARVAGGLDGRPGQVDRDTLERHLSEGTVAPQGIHAQSTWKMPKNFTDLYRTGKELSARTARGLMTGPSNFLNRTPWMNVIFDREYDRMVMEGIPREVARERADEYAVNRVNGILHRFDEPSRAAATVDMFLPFQHAREDLLRAYGKLIIENPARTFRVEQAVARAFQNGKDNGTFRKNPMTGEYELTVPGGGRIASILFGQGNFQVNMETPAQDLLYMGAGGYGLGPGQGNLGSGFIPGPGGPFWSVFSKGLAEAYPEVYKGSYPLHDWLYPYGENGSILGSNASRLWMAMAGSPPPWEVLNQEYWKNQSDHYQREVGQALMHAHWSKTGDKSWVPSDEEVADATKAFFKAWSFYQAAVPNKIYATLPDQGSYQSAVNLETMGGLLPLDYESFSNKYPQFEPYLQGGSSTEYTGPDDLATIQDLGIDGEWGVGRYNPETGMWDSGTAPTDYTKQKRLGWRTDASWSDFKQQFKDNQRTSQYYTKLSDANAISDPLQRDRAISALHQAYPDLVGKYAKSNEITTEVNTILFSYPKQQQAEALQRVRSTYGLTNIELLKFQKKASDPTWQPNVWASTRDGSVIANEVNKRFGNHTGGEVERYVATLRPTEQARYWQYMADAVGYDERKTSAYEPTDAVARDALNQYHYYIGKYFDVRSQNPATVGKRDTVWSNPEYSYISKLKSHTQASVQALYDVVGNIADELNNAYAVKNYKLVDALTAKRDQLYNEIDQTRYQWLGKLPDLTDAYDDLHMMTVYEATGRDADAKNSYRQAVLDAQKAPYILTSDQSSFAHMPAPVQAAYMRTLVDSLDMPVGKSDYDVTQYVKEQTGLHKMYWDYMTPVQQSQLTTMYPNMVDRWKYSSWWYLQGPGKASKANHFKGAHLDESKIPHDLVYAHALLGKYNQRGGKTAPAAVNEYLHLPHNWAVKSQFLISHPEVRDWLQAGPIMNMPAHERDMVTNTLIKYGGSTGGYSSKSWYGVHPAGKGFNGAPGPRGSGYADYKWAKYQLYAWSRRTPGAKPPPTYDLWVNMPSGPAKAEYIRQHPEIQQWLRLGAMANMPEEYRQVVQEILQTYGDWTADQNPLGDTITQFYATPSYAKQEFLAQHPELQVYWSYTRSPDEQAMFELENSYFQINDIGAKQAFLLEHPELQQHFIDARTKRYEMFLNQVAAYMGANPELFKEYLNRQNDLIAELLRKFAEPMLIREASPTTVDTGGSAGESGRSRKPGTGPPVTHARR